MHFHFLQEDVVYFNMCSDSLINNITWDGLKDSSSENVVILAEECPWGSFCLTKRSAKYDFLEIYEMFNVTNSANLGW